MHRTSMEENIAGDDGDQIAIPRDNRISSIDY